jgi:hypothetical protein
MDLKQIQNEIEHYRQVEERKQNDLNVCNQMIQLAQKNNFKSCNEHYKAADQECKKLQIDIIKNVFSKNKFIKNVLLFGDFLDAYIRNDDRLFSYIEIILIVFDYTDLISNDIKTIELLFKENRGRLFYDLPEFPDYNKIDVIILHDNFKFIKRFPQTEKQFNLFDVGNRYEVIL